MTSRSPFSLSGVRGVITGAGSGIGRATAIAFAEAGASMLFLCGRRRPQLEGTAALLAPSCTAVIVDADVTVPEHRARLVAEVQKHGGALDALINNAGRFDGLTAKETSDAAWRDSFAANVDAPFALVRDLLPALVASTQGNVVNVSSTLAVKPIPIAAAYNSAKAALAQMTRSLALELAPQGVRVNCVLPAIVETPMYRGRYADDLAYDAGMQAAAKLHPLGRNGRPEDIAFAIVYLASPAAAWVTGVGLPVDGGMLVT